MVRGERRMSAVEQLYMQIEKRGKRKRSLPQPTEAEIHRAVVAQLRLRAAPGVVWFHVPNDGKRSPGTYKRLQAMGLRAGVHDLVFVHRGHFYSLEIKSARGRPTAEQMRFSSDINAAGGHAMIVNELDRAIRALECWGILR